MKRGLLIMRVVVGAVALTFWLLFFASGLLVETVEYRRFLAPNAFADQPQADATAAANTSQPYTGSAAFAFIAAMLCFTPTNLVFVTLLAGFLGGCASNIVAENLDVDQLRQVHPRRLMYLEETPWSAMMRSFIVYLCVIAGLYFAMDDPFKNSTPAQYMRLAGTLSLMAFVVGYDPSRIEQWLRLVPNPQPSQVVTIRDNKERIEMTATQGPLVTQATPIDDNEPAAAALFSSREADENQRETSLGAPKRRKAK